MSGRIFTFDEDPDSQASTIEPPSLTLKYLASGEPDRDTVEIYATAATAETLFTSQGALYRQDIRLEPAGYARYMVTVPYGPDKKDVGSFSFSYDTTGATIKIKAAKEHISAFTAEGEDDSDIHKGAIGVTNDLKVEGCDIVIPACKFAYTFKHPQGVVTEEFAMALARQTGKTNQNDWRAFKAGEALFLGSTGSGGTDTAAEATYNILASENADESNPLTIGDIMNIIKEGHHYAWIEFADDVVDGQPAVQPTRVNIERVYDPVDFFTYFQWE